MDVRMNLDNDVGDLLVPQLKTTYLTVVPFVWS